MREFQGISAYQLKWIALIFMTVDHLSWKIEGPTFLYFPLKILGRCAAPLFLFALVESMHHTKSKLNFALRLLVGGEVTGLITVLTNLLAKGSLEFWPDNIFFTYFYLIVYVYLIESAIEAKKRKSIKRMLQISGGLLCTFLPQLIWIWIDGIDLSSIGISLHWQRILKLIFISIVPRTLYVEYSLLFVVMGVFLYFAKNRKQQCVIFLAFCILSFCGSKVLLTKDLWPFNDFFGDGQYYMVLALPFMLLYNGEKGKSHKLFFYAYYPIHRLLIALL